MKPVVIFILVFISIITIDCHAQNGKPQIDINSKEFKQLEEYASARKKARNHQMQLSPYDPKTIGMKLNPMMPNCRNVSKADSLDQALVRILYAFNAEDIANPRTYDDLQRLEIGKKYAKYYSAFVYEADSVMTQEGLQVEKLFHIPFDSDALVAMSINGKHQGWSRYLFSELYKDFAKKELTEYCRMPDCLERYNSFYIESIPEQNWQMFDETEMVAGYLCQKATCNFRGRNYTAWFAIDIPMSLGPWKFCGLPGLILKVYDDAKEYCLECVGIEQNSSLPIKKIVDYKNYRRTNRADLDKLIKRISENYYQLSGLTNVVNTQLNLYYPMELE